MAVRGATLLIVVGLVGLAACNDVRDFAGSWSGDRVGDEPVLRVGEGERATLTIDKIDKHGLRGQLLVVGADPASPLVDTAVRSLEAAEADALATMTFAGEPMRVYLAFVPTAAGDALAIIALYDSHRIELRLLKGEPQPLYAIYALTES